MNKVADEILLGAWCEPFTGGALVPENIALEADQLDVNEISNVLAEWARAGLLTDKSTMTTRLYEGTPELWRRREERLVELGWRTRPLREQLAFPLQDLIVAVLYSTTIHNIKMPAGFMSAYTLWSYDELCVYLNRYSLAEIRASTRDLVAHGFAQDGRKDHSALSLMLDGVDRSVPALELTPAGLLHARRTVQGKLGLDIDESILSLTKKETIEIFYSWQSDDRATDKEIRKALRDAVSDLKESARFPLRIVLATEAGDGATRIDQALLGKIMACDFFIADITPVALYRGRLCSNPNVLIETGYGLASRPPDDLFLLCSLPATKALTGDSGAAFPFDISTVHRINFTSTAGLKASLVKELRVRLARRSLLLVSPSA